jgi:hypothetical protein
MPAGNGDIVQAVMNMTMYSGDEAKNVFVWRLDKISLGDLSDAQLATSVTDCLESMYATIDDIITDDMSFDTIDVYKRVGTVWDYLTTDTPSITPTGTFDVLPSGVAMLATAYTEANKVFGRKFLYGVIESQVTQGTLIAGALTALAAFAGEYISLWQSGSMGPLDYLVPGVWSTKTAAFEPFGSVAVVKDTLSYQRRRKTGVGV